MLFISPPFGNYVSLHNTKRIKGSYTLYPREGLLLQILKTLRFSFKHGGWINKIGLRNKGLQYGLDNYCHETDILSISIIEESEINPVLKMLPENVNIELNISCPNKKVNDKSMEKFLNPKREWCILKLSPLTKNETIRTYYNNGFRQFHCCNTLPIQNGGLSGPSLIPYISKMILEIKKYPQTIVIAGGGIQNMETLNFYKGMGANHYSISTLLFNPIKFSMFYNKYSSI